MRLKNPLKKPPKDTRKIEEIQLSKLWSFRYYYSSNFPPNIQPY